MFIRSARGRLLAGAVVVAVLTPDVARALHAVPPPQLQITRRPESSPPSPAPRVGATESTATSSLAQARTELARTIAALREAMLESPKYLEAVETLQVARSDLQTAAMRVLNVVRLTPEYRAQQSRVVAAELRLEQARRDDASGGAALQQAALAAAQERSALTRIEAAALGADAAVISARQRVVDASRALVLLQRDLRAAMLTDPGYTAARQRLDAARRAVASAAG